MAKTLAQLAHEWVAAVTRPGITAAELAAVSIGGDRAGAYGRGIAWHSGNVRAPIAAIVPGVTVAPEYTVGSVGDDGRWHSVAAPIPEGAPARVALYMVRACLGSSGFGQRDSGGNAIAALRDAVNTWGRGGAHITGAMATVGACCDPAALLGGDTGRILAARAWAEELRAKAAECWRPIDTARENLRWRIWNAREAFRALRDPARYCEGMREMLAARGPGMAAVRAARDALAAECRVLWQHDSAADWRVALPIMERSPLETDAEAIAARDAIRAALAARAWPRKRAQIAAVLAKRIEELRELPPAAERAANDARLAAAALADDARIAALATREAFTAALVAHGSQIAGTVPTRVEATEWKQAAKAAKRAGRAPDSIPHWRACKRAERAAAAMVAKLAEDERAAYKVARALDSCARGFGSTIAPNMPACNARVALARADAATMETLTSIAVSAWVAPAECGAEDWDSRVKACERGERIAGQACEQAPALAAVVARHAAWTETAPRVFYPEALRAEWVRELERAREGYAAAVAVNDAEVARELDAAEAQLAEAFEHAARGEWAAVRLPSGGIIRTDGHGYVYEHTSHATIERGRRLAARYSEFHREHGDAMREWQRANAAQAWRNGGGSQYLDYSGPTLLRMTAGGRVETSRGAVVPGESAHRLYRAWRIARERGDYAGIAGSACGPYTVTRVSDDSVWIGCHVIGWEEAARFAASVGW